MLLSKLGPGESHLSCLCYEMAVCIHTYHMIINLASYQDLCLEIKNLKTVIANKKHGKFSKCRFFAQ